MKIKNMLGQIFFAAGFILFFVHNFLVIKDSSESFARDWLNLPVYTPPAWVGVIPYLGGLLEYIWQLFSLHGLVGLVVLILFCGIGVKLWKDD